MLACRMAVAKDPLRRQDRGISAGAELVGYRSAGTFNTAFSRHVGQPPSRYSATVSAAADTSTRPTNRLAAIRLEWRAM